MLHTFLHVNFSISCSSVCESYLMCIHTQTHWLQLYSKEHHYVICALGVFIKYRESQKKLHHVLLYIGKTQ